MAGRLQQYDDFIQKSNYNMTEQKKPIKKDKNQKQVKKQLQSDNVNVVFKLSKQRKLICYLFYNKKNSKGSNEKVYRMIVIPEKSLIKRGKMYVQIIDVNLLVRKLIRKDRIIKVQLTDKQFKANQSSITYRK